MRAIVNINIKTFNPIIPISIVNTITSPSPKPAIIKASFLVLNKKCILV